ncbi:hypothetical protein GE09DRAFT_1293650 [Coniochaeta sp. 2T2.1]|nr:hypothetical protein GE09DRAFT_1293650 [Coniochaeta sp. 2T2.1]
MDAAHQASAIAQIVFYAPIVPLTLYVGIRAWKYGPRLAWYPVMAFACARLTGGALLLASRHDPANRELLTAAIVLLNVGLVPLIMPFHALTRVVLEENFPENKRKKIFIKVTRWLLLGAVILLSAAGGLINHPENAKIQAVLSKVAYFEFVFVLLALMGMAAWLYLASHARPIEAGQMIYIKWLLITSPFLCIRLVFGAISVFKAAGPSIRTSIWSSMFGSAVLFSLMALLPEYTVLCVFIYLGFHRYHTADRYGLIPQTGIFKRRDQKEKEKVSESGTELV